jgi:hypothetical protein
LGETVLPVKPMGELFYYNYAGATSVIRGAVFGRTAGREAAAAAP